jgi:flagellar assembly protein FliH
MSFSSGYSDVLPLSFAALQYRDIAGSAGADLESRNGGGEEDSAHEGKRRNEEAREAEIAARIREARMEAVSQIEQKLRQEYEQKLLAARQPIADAVRGFAEQREDYFARVESEIVQLALSIAAKILHRESQVDPMLVATLVRLSVEKMREGSNVTIKVGSGLGASWKRYFAEFPNPGRIEVNEDPQLSDQDCILETELGTANFGLDAQLKEVERGFFDLLALRPAGR